MPTPTALRRRWLRFSLRTLLLFVLLIGSSATLWWNWGPWTQVLTITEPHEIQRVAFDASNQLLILYGEPPTAPETQDGHTCLDVRDQFGKQRHLFKFASFASDLSLVGDYAIMRAPQISSPFGSSSTKMPTVLNLRSLEPVDLTPLEKEFPGYSSNGFSPHFLVLEKWEPDFACIAVSLATLKSAGKIPIGSQLSDDRVFVATRDGFEVRDLLAGKTVTIPRLQPAGRSPNIFQSMPDILILRAAELYVPGQQSMPSHENEMLWAINPTDGSEFFHQKGSFEGCSFDGHSILIRIGTEIQLLDAFSGKKIASFPGVTNSPTFTSNNDFLLSDDNCVYDAHTGVVHWAIPDKLGASLGSGDILCLFDETRTWLAECRTRRLLMPIPSPFAGNDWSNPEFSPDASHFVVRHIDPDRFSHIDADSLDSQVHLFRLARPWQWYGPAYLPEFWLTLVLAIGFLWSVWRDRRLGTRA